MSRRLRPGQVAGGIAILGALVALVTILFGGLLEILFGATVPTIIFEVVRAALPLIGVVLVVAVSWQLRKTDNQVRVPEEFADSSTGSQSLSLNDGRVGTEIDERLTNAASDWYRCETTFSISEVQSHLVESAVRVVKTGRGLTESDAAAAVETGRWTDDPVAAAFLSPKLSQPLLERLRGALDPAKAFRRRVDHTLAAIEELENQTAATGNSSVYEDTPSPGSVSGAQTDTAGDTEGGNSTDEAVMSS